MTFFFICTLICFLFIVSQCVWHSNFITHSIFCWLCKCKLNSLYRTMQHNKSKLILHRIFCIDYAKLNLIRHIAQCNIIKCKLILHRTFCIDYARLSLIRHIVQCIAYAILILLCMEYSALFMQNLAFYTSNILH